MVFIAFKEGQKYAIFDQLCYAHNGLVAGSSPAWPTNLTKTYRSFQF